MAQTVRETVPTNTTDTEAEARFRRAKERVENIRGFYIHLGIYLIVNLGIFVLNWVLMALYGAAWFFYWPLVGWGIGVLINGYVVFFGDRILGPEWEERKLREELAKERRAR